MRRGGRGRCPGEAPKKRGACQLLHWGGVQAEDAAGYRPLVPRGQLRSESNGRSLPSKGKFRKKGTSNPLAVSLRGCPRLPLRRHAGRRRLRHQKRRRQPCLHPLIPRALLRRRRRRCPRRGCQKRAGAPAIGAGRLRGEPRKTRAHCQRSSRRARARPHYAPAVRPPGRFAWPATAGTSDARTGGGSPPPRAATPWRHRVGGVACGARQARLPAEPWRPAAPSWPPRRREREGTTVPRREAAAASGPAAARDGEWAKRWAADRQPRCWADPGRGHWNGGLAQAPAEKATPALPRRARATQ